MSYTARNESCFGNLRLVRQDGASRDQTFVVGLAECTNNELRTAWEMYMRLFQTPLLLKNEESLDNKSIKGSKHLRIAMESLRRC